MMHPIVQSYDEKWIEMGEEGDVKELKEVWEELVQRSDAPPVILYINGLLNIQMEVINSLLKEVTKDEEEEIPF